jgi:DNA-binding transcriptional LysR family regulator
MELRHLRYFVAVADMENVSRAALKLHVSQPGLSRQVRDLEDEIGFQLFERGAKSLRLTEAGKVFLVEARAVLARAEEAVKKARLVAGSVSGELHVGYAPSLTVEILPRALRKFQETFPKVRVLLHDLSTEEMLSQLGSGALQVALMPRACKIPAGMGFEELARYPMCVMVSPKHPFAKKKKITLQEIVEEPLIGYTRKDYPDYHEAMEKIFAPTGKAARIVEEHDGVNSIIAAVESGRGFALAPSCIACMVGPRLKLLPIEAGTSPIPVMAVWRTKEVSDLVAKFVAAARRPEVSPNGKTEVAGAARA